MTLEEVYEYYGSANRAAKAIGVSRQAFYGWIRRGFVPYRQQLKFERVTKGILKATERLIIKDAKESEPMLPKYRYYSEQFGMCEVKAIFFKSDTCPRIVYAAKDNILHTTLNGANLMQMTTLKDINGLNLYERDIILYDKLELIVNSLYNLQFALTYSFQIIGNIFEGKKNGY